jgi:hypothetical protein
VNDELVQLIKDARFSTRNTWRAYAEPEVDTLLDWLVEALTIGAPLQPVLDRGRLRKIWFHHGYEIKAVDSFIAQLMAAPVQVDPGQEGANPPPYST